MVDQLKLMCILPHPDDETLGTGGILAKYAAEGIETYLMMVTRGEKGWGLDPAIRPGPQEIGRMREEELRCASQILGIKEVFFMGYIDGEVADADPQEVISRMVTYLRQVKPQVVVTFDPFGVYGHPDHIATSQLAVSAVVNAASPAYQDPGDSVPHVVQKLYYMAEPQAIFDMFGDAPETLCFEVDGNKRCPVPWPDWSISTWIDIADYWQTVVQAIRCHYSQGLNGDQYAAFPEKFDRHTWGFRGYYRVFSLVNGGRAVETDLFAGLR